MLKIGDKVQLSWCHLAGIVEDIINEKGIIRYKIYHNDNSYTLMNESDVKAGLIEKVGDN